MDAFLVRHQTASECKIIRRYMLNGFKTTPATVWHHLSATAGLLVTYKLRIFRRRQNTNVYATSLRSSTLKDFSLTWNETRSASLLARAATMSATSSDVCTRLTNITMIINPTTTRYTTLPRRHDSLAPTAKKGKGRTLDIAPQVDMATTKALRYMARSKQRRKYLPYTFPAIAGTHLPTRRGWRVE